MNYTLKMDFGSEEAPSFSLNKVQNKCCLKYKNNNYSCVGNLFCCFRVVVSVLFVVSIGTLQLLRLQSWIKTLVTELSVRFLAAQPRMGAPALAEGWALAGVKAFITASFGKACVF